MWKKNPLVLSQENICLQMNEHEFKESTKLYLQCEKKNKPTCAVPGQHTSIKLMPHSTAHNSLMPDMAAGSRLEEEAKALLSRPGDITRLLSGDVGFRFSKTRELNAEEINVKFYH